MMMMSREAAVNYMTPLGLAHLMARNHHYGPGPWVSGGPRADWTSVYYHRADTLGIGFDRSPTGSNAVAQYFSPLREHYGNRKTVPDSLLLWFHRVGWDERMRSGRTLWEELLHRYQTGVDSVRQMQKIWSTLQGKIDEERFHDVEAFLKIQEKEARWWRDASVLYFQTFSRRPLPAGYERPEHALEYYMSIVSRFPG
jgi:alpha-glucuronidase